MDGDPISWGPVHGSIRDNIKNNRLIPHLMDNFTDLLEILDLTYSKISNNFLIFS